MTNNNTVVILHNATIAKLHNPDQDLCLLLNDILSYKVDDGMYGDGQRQTFFSMSKKSFPAGFVRLVRMKLQRKGYKVLVRSKSMPEPLGPERPVVDDFPDDPRYNYQHEAVDRLTVYGGMIARCATGCHAKGTQVITYEGHRMRVEDVRVGDLLLGPDSRPRKVKKLCRGRGLMYRITPKRHGREFVVNDEHILSLTSREIKNKGEIVNISVKDFVRKSNRFKARHHLYQPDGVDFYKPQLMPVDPYSLGVLCWATSSDEDPNLFLASVKKPVHEELVLTAEEFGIDCHTDQNGSANTVSCTLKPYVEGDDNPLSRKLNDLGMGYQNVAHIPFFFKRASRNDRLKLLAGLIDQRGSFDSQRQRYMMETFSWYMARDIDFVGRSVGLSVSITEKRNPKHGLPSSFVITLSGPTHRIPSRVYEIEAKENTKTMHSSTFDVHPVGLDSFYGFHLDGDHLYLMDDFTVTHNSGKSRIFKLAAERIKRPTLFLTTRKSLMYQMANIYEADLKTGVGILGDSQWTPRTKGVNFAIVDTLSARLQEKSMDKEVERALESHYAMVEKETKKELKRRKLPKDESLIKHLPNDVKTRYRAICAEIRDKYKLNRDSLAREVTLSVEAHNQRRQDIISFLAGIEFLCLEEAHESGSNSFYDVSMACTNARYRLALTATPFMRDSEESNMRLMAVSGPVGIKVTEKELIDKGILAKPYFVFKKLIPPKGMYRSMGYQAAYELGIVKNPHRNKAIVKEVKRAVDHGLTAMVLVQRTAHGTILKKLLEQVVEGVMFIQGSDKQNIRQSALNALGAGDINCLIGTSILDVGVDVPSVGLIVLAGGGKAEVANRQRIGRGLRAKKNGENVAFILDFTDQGNNTLTRHARERRRIIESTDGFKEGIVSDFPYHWSISKTGCA